MGTGLFIAMAGGLSAALVPGVGNSPSPTVPTITVLVYNYALSPEVLATTEFEVAAIFRRGGVEIQWLEYPVDQKDSDRLPAGQIRPGPSTLILRILSKPMAKCVRQTDDQFGFAMLSNDGRLAKIANVFSYEPEQLAKGHEIRYATILGPLVAHELGHLLLGVGSHASRGIMHVPWGRKELNMIRQGLIAFTPEQAENIRANSRVRRALETEAGHRTR